jgi:hypothetical protein
LFDDSPSAITYDLVHEDATKENPKKESYMKEQKGFKKGGLLNYHGLKM